MLIEIECNLFREQKISFKQGLNVVLGDNQTSNSIGKSTILMIIDFVFGGTDFIKNDGGAIKKLGEHVFKFKFYFSNEYLYFIRKTKNQNIIFCCNEKYTPQYEISLEEFRNLLKEKYNLQNLSDLSFREVIGTYSRIWGKDNLNVKKPLQVHKAENDKKSVNKLIKLFNKYNLIKEYDEKVDYLTGKKKSLADASKYKVVQSVSKKEYDEAIDQIKDLELKIQELTKDIEQNRSRLNGVISSEVIDLKKEISQLQLDKNKKIEELNSIKINLAIKNPKLKKQLLRLQEYFLNINLEKLNVIDEFHHDISNILKKNLTEREDILKMQIDKKEKEIDLLTNRINEIMSYEENDTVKYSMDRLHDLFVQKSELENIVKDYDLKKLTNAELKKSESGLSDIRKDVCIELSDLINNKINHLNSFIHIDKQFSPYLDVNNSNYSFRIPNDTGTGKAYASLITFDLAILSLTSLPILIHDSVLFKNIENSVLGNIIEIYHEQQKQVFISIDEINKYDLKTQKFLEEDKILQLSNEKLLYKIRWNIEDNQRNN